MLDTTQLSYYCFNSLKEAKRICPVGAKLNYEKILYNRTFLCNNSHTKDYYICKSNNHFGEFSDEIREEYDEVAYHLFEDGLWYPVTKELNKIEKKW